MQLMTTHDRYTQDAREAARYRYGDWRYDSYGMTPYGGYGGYGYDGGYYGMAPYRRGYYGAYGDAYYSPYRGAYNMSPYRRGYYDDDYHSGYGPYRNGYGYGGYGDCYGGFCDYDDLAAFSAADRAYVRGRPWGY